MTKPCLYLIHGFMGFGKTTYAKKLAESTGAMRFTHDEIMFERFGATPDDFQRQCKEVTDYIWEEAAKLLKTGQSVILDFGFWDKKTRKEAYERGIQLCDNVVFHALSLDLEIAKERVLRRTKEDPSALYIDESCFNDRLRYFEPMCANEGLPVQFILNF